MDVRWSYLLLDTNVTEVNYEVDCKIDPYYSYTFAIGINGYFFGTTAVYARSANTNS